MKRLALCFILVAFFSVAFSQRVYFVYLQSESEQPFYVKLNDKTYSSAPSGYLVLSKLRDTTYDLNIGFPQGQSPEQKFSINVGAKDHGYLLKNFEDKSWGLFDLQTLAIHMPAFAGKDNIAKTEQKQVSTFTDVLSKAANDPSLKEKPVTIKQEEKPEIVQPAIVKDEIKKDSVIVNPLVVNDLPVKKEEPLVIKEDIVVQKNDQGSNLQIEYKKSSVTKKSESSTTEGVGLIFIDEYADGERDTINIMIPNSRQPDVETKRDPNFLNIESQSDTGEKDKTVIDKNDCSSFASENDFLKLRKKMAGEKNSDNMIEEAQKVFRSKCFTVSQVKNLSTLFLEEAGKYKFFDEAYTHVSDIENYSELISELKDEYYINRFRAMLK